MDEMTTFTDGQCIMASLNTLKASSLESILSGMFGRKVTGTDGEHRVVLKLWRGKFYMIDYSPNRATPTNTRQGG